MSSFSLETRKKNTAGPVVSPISRSSLPGAEAKAWFFSGQQPSGSADAAGAGRG